MDECVYLYPVFRELCLHGQHLSGVHVRVVGLVEGLLQLLQLVGREHRPEDRQTTRMFKPSTS